MNENKKQGYLFALFYLIVFGALGGMFPYINAYLQSNQGFTGAQIGTYTFCTLMIAMFIVPIWGIIGDKTRKYKFLLLISLGASVVAAFAYSMASGYIMVMITGIILEVSRSGTIPLSDVQAVNFTTKTGGNYGSIRSKGSLGYVLGSVLVGFVVGNGDYSKMFVIYIALLLLAFAIAFTFPNEEIEKEEKVEEKQKGGFFSVIKNKNFLFLCAIALMTTILMESVNGYAAIHMLNKLNGPDNSPTFFTIATALPEILLLGTIGALLNKTGYKKVFLVNAAILAIRYILYAFSPNIYVFLAASLVHCLGTAIHTVGNLGYLRNTIPASSYGTAVTLYNSVVSVGRAVYGLIFGYVMDFFGTSAIFLIAAIIMGAGTFIISKTHLFDDVDHMIKLQQK